MRIIAGQWRSRRLVRPRTDATRPMPDRVKQAVFDVLAVHYETPGGLPPLLVADLFAGSGSAGLEALSRGAARCWFFERNRDALLALRANIEALGAAGDTEVVLGDAWRAKPFAAGGRPFGLIFLDPPYRDAEDATPAGPVRQFLRSWSAGIEAPSLLVFHHPAAVRYELAAEDGWMVMDRRDFGTNGVTFFSR